MNGTCTDCGRSGRLARRDLCSACYQRLWKVGALPVLAPSRRAPRVKRDCQCKRANHLHGTRLGYVVDRCRCDDCTSANTAEMADLRAIAMRARWCDGPDTRSGLVDAAAAREHLRMLMRAGMGLKTIASKGGVAHGSISAIMYGKSTPNPLEARPPRTRIRRDLERRILAITLDLADHALVDGTGTRRRLRALVAIGWSQQRLSRLLGITPSNFGHLIHSDRRVLKATADLARRVYDDCWASPPVLASHHERAGITRARAGAAQHGWPPPLAWDDDTIDDPAAQPDLGEQRRRIQARVEDAVELLQLGEHPELIAARLGVTLAALTQNIRHYAPEHANPFAAAHQRQRSAA